MMLLVAHKMLATSSTCSIRSFVNPQRPLPWLHPHLCICPPSARHVLRVALPRHLLHPCLQHLSTPSSHTPTIATPAPQHPLPRLPLHRRIPCEGCRPHLSKPSSHHIHRPVTCPHETDHNQTQSLPAFAIAPPPDAVAPATTTANLVSVLSRKRSTNA